MKITVEVIVPDSKFIDVPLATSNRKYLSLKSKFPSKQDAKLNLL